MDLLNAQMRRLVCDVILHGQACAQDAGGALAYADAQRALFLGTAIPGSPQEVEYICTLFLYGRCRDSDPESQQAYAYARTALVAIILPPPPQAPPQASFAQAQSWIPLPENSNQTFSFQHYSAPENVPGPIPLDPALTSEAPVLRDGLPSPSVLAETLLPHGAEGYGLRRLYNLVVLHTKTFPTLPIDASALSPLNTHAYKCRYFVSYYSGTAAMEAIIRDFSPWVNFDIRQVPGSGPNDNDKYMIYIRTPDTPFFLHAQPVRIWKRWQLQFVVVT